MTSPLILPISILGEQFPLPDSIPLRSRDNLLHPHTPIASHPQKGIAGASFNTLSVSSERCSHDNLYGSPIPLSSSTLSHPGITVPYPLPPFKICITLGIRVARVVSKV
ncbi:hypothetical protein CEXT_506321 [Caerostris extrusa]|uniref:Uncharacterized protein n=1 Tax=Caerostris extrusa TaxID=172846 RepID=A0AAV4W4M6_CAEEX|nr:hypothetical protein CEXT_506321 [Caerostris extrusa]